LNGEQDKALFFYDQSLESSNVETKALALANITQLKCQNQEKEELDETIV
jgi:hypothetical protein